MQQTRLNFQCRRNPATSAASLPGSPAGPNREKRPRQCVLQSELKKQRVPPRPPVTRQRTCKPAPKLLFAGGRMVKPEVEGGAEEECMTLPPVPPIPCQPAVYVVDKHHDALRPIFGQMAAGAVPPTGLTLIHFDSHPDLACLPQDTPKTLVANLARGQYDTAWLHSKCDIASWIMPLVLAGHVSEVVWLSNWWCQQMDPGTYRLRVGVLKNEMKIAPEVDDATVFEQVGLYWHAGGSWVSAAQLREGRPFTLHVCRSRRGGQFAPKDVELVRRLAVPGRWILDFDEDYVSCANPFQEEFLSTFGRGPYETLRQTYDPSVDAASHWQRLRALVCSGIYRDEPERVQQHSVFKHLLQDTSAGLLQEFHALCLGLHDATGGRITAAEFFDPTLIHSAGETAGLPHHISKLGELVSILNHFHELMRGLPLPGLVTVATSRADRYLPDSQATRIHSCVSRLLADLYHVPVTAFVRLDRPECSVPYCPFPRLSAQCQ